MNLVAPSSKELAADVRQRTDENIRRLGVSIMSLQNSMDESNKAMGENKAAQSQLGKEVIRRLEDMQLSSSTSSSSLNATTSTDISRLKQLTGESREALSQLTACVNGLVNMPAQFAGLQRSVNALAGLANLPTRLLAMERTIQSLEIRQARPVAAEIVAAPVPPPVTPVQGSMAAMTPRTGGIKRPHPAFAPVDEEESMKRSRTEDAFWCDVFLFPVHLKEAPPMQIAKLALDAVGLTTEGLVSAVHPHNLPKDFISMRFNGSPPALEFIDRLRNNPPQGMSHIQAMTAAAFNANKNREGNSMGRRGKQKDAKPW
ncbi:hypothetical protein K438DRAFT_1895080 [Mycena galopus ATCC 62051]|nr:hypothetical protein K438DRAFT_1895080 [Mycena galopus ATCC 62051]